jgi:hypothetical protein
MAKKVTVNANYEPVGDGSPDAAFIFNADDVRLEKYQARAKAELKSGRRQPVTSAVAADEDDGSVERVGRGRRSSSTDEEPTASSTKADKS